MYPVESNGHLPRAVSSTADNHWEILEAKYNQFKRITEVKMSLVKYEEKTLKKWAHTNGEHNKLIAGLNNKKIYSLKCNMYINFFFF